MKRPWVWTLGLIVAGIGASRSLVHSEETASPANTTAQSAPAADESAGARPLNTLDWLVGNWVEDDDTPAIEFSCKFTKNGAFLLRSFRTFDGNEVKLSGMQLIAWDPAQKAMRSWTYDSNGGFGEERWSQSGNRYTIRSSYTLPDGGRGSNIQIVTFVDNDTFKWKSVNREIDGTLMPDTDEVVLVRKAVDDSAKGVK